MHPIRSTVLASLAAGSLWWFAAAEVVAPDLFTAQLGDGQRITGTIPAQVEIKTRFGTFTVARGRIVSVRAGADHFELHLANGDELHGVIVSPLTLGAVDGPEIDLAEAGLETLGRAAPLLATDWSEPVHHLRARLIALDPPKGPTGEMLLVIELQNTHPDETLVLQRPSFHDRVIHPKQIHDHSHHDAWLTAFQEVEQLEERLQELEEIARPNGEHILPGGSYRLQVAVPYAGGARNVSRVHERRVGRDELEKLKEPRKEVTHFFGTETLFVDPGRIHFRGYYQARPPGNGAGDWRGSVTTPLLTLEIPPR